MERFRKRGRWIARSTAVVVVGLLGAIFLKFVHEGRQSVFRSADT